MSNSKIMVFSAAILSGAGTYYLYSNESENSFDVGDSFKDCDEIHCPEMVVLPAGKFQMGDLGDVGGDDEKPVHEVTIAAKFATGKYPVTRGEYAEFIRETGYDMGSECYGLEDMRPITWENPGFEQTNRDPVVCVNWIDADNYIKWLNESTGQNYRMLTEAEWEYAGRAGTTTNYSFGDDEATLCEYSNGADLAVTKWVEEEADYWAKRNMSCNDGYGQATSPVGLYKPNKFGLYDMEGNVWEWVEDCWTDGNATYENARSDAVAYKEPNCTRMANRGGSWDDQAWSLRLSNRGRNGVDTRYNALGFRLARDLK